jgi:hypothetical protein
MRRASLSAPWLCVVVVLGGGCSKADLSAAAFVDGLRILGVQAEPPEPHVGDSVVLTAWVVDPEGRTINVGWSACLLPSSGTANPGCIDGTGNGLVGLGSGLSITMTVPDVDAATLGPPDATYGVYLPIVVHAQVPGDARDAVYRLRLRVIAPPGCPLDPPFPKGSHCEPNRNPVFDTIDPLGPEGAPIPTYAGQIWGLLPRFSTDSDEEYMVMQTGGVPERLIAQWFATAGSFPDTPVGGTAVQKFTIDRALPPLGGTIDLWVVGHDERGGIALAHRTFVLQ